MLNGTTMQEALNPTINPSNTALGRIASAPLRLVTVREWWDEMNEPTEMLADADAVFAADEAKLLSLCSANAIAFRAAADKQPAAFPAWLFLAAIPANP